MRPALPMTTGFGQNANSPAELGPHDLTSNTSHAPFVVSASGQFGPQPEWHAFNGTGTDFWIGTGGVVDWLQIDLGSAQVLGSYSIRGTTETARMPRDWTMRGSNAGGTWTTLDTWAGSTAWEDNSTRSFNIPVISAAFRYYRLNITANNGDGNYTDVGELSLFQGVLADLSDQTITFPVISGHHPTDAPFALAATSDSGLAVSFSVTSGPATVAGNTATLTGATGNVTILASQAGNGTYNAAPPVN